VLLPLTFLLYACAPGNLSHSLPPEEGLPATPPYSSKPSPEKAISLSKRHLAAKLKISTDQITAVSVEKVNWSDTSLGLPKPDMVYAQVIVPGFKITLRALGQDYLYHAGVISNKMVVLPAN